MSEKDDLRESLSIVTEAIEQMESIARGEGGAICFAADPNYERAHRVRIRDDDLSMVTDKFEADILLPAFRKLRDEYQRRLDA